MATQLSEADTRAKLIDPALHARGWTEDLIRREETAGPIVLSEGGPRKLPKGRIDYTLRVRVAPQAQAPSSSRDRIRSRLTTGPPNPASAEVFMLGAMRSQTRAITSVARPPRNPAWQSPETCPVWLRRARPHVVLPPHVGQNLLWIDLDAADLDRKLPGVDVSVSAIPDLHG